MFGQKKTGGTKTDTKPVMIRMDSDMTSGIDAYYLTLDDILIRPEATQWILVNFSRRSICSFPNAANSLVTGGM